MSKIQDMPTSYSPDWLEKLDRRTNLAKAVNERLHVLTTDLGGMEYLSYQQRSLAKRAVWAEAILEQMEASLARGKEIDLGKYTQQTNSLIGLLKTLGLERQTRDVPSLRDVLREAQA